MSEPGGSSRLPRWRLGSLDAGERVRLIGVDTPESVDPRRPVQCFGRQAAAFTRRVVESRWVRPAYGDEKKNRGGRTLAFVYLQDGTFLNALLVREQYAHACTRHPFKYIEEFRRYECEDRLRCANRCQGCCLCHWGDGGRER
jgi:micrococcal nuclease